MRTTTRSVRTTVASSPASCLLSGCGTPGTGEASAPEASASRSVSRSAPLVPGNTVEEYGTQVLESLWTGLVEYDTDGAVSYTGVADAIESEDSATWTVRLRDGWTFHDGTPVTAESFVAAWNYTAYSPNAQAGSYFFANIEGYGDLQAPVDDAGEPTGEPAATEMSGLQRRRRAHLHRHADRAVRPVPGHPRLQPLLPLPRHSSTTRRPSDAAPSATDRSGPTASSSPVRASRWRRTRSSRASSAVGRRGRVPGLRRHRHRLHRRAGRQPRRRPADPGRRERHGAGGLRRPVRRVRGLRLHVPRPAAVPGAVRRPPRAPGAVDGDRPRDDRRARSSPVPAGGGLGRAAGRGGAP